MPQYITIKNFGPITSIEKMEVKDFMLFIGERATGKSTIATLIYFFKDLNIRINSYFYELYYSEIPVDSLQYLYASIQTQFRYTNQSYVNPNTKIRFSFSENSEDYVEITQSIIFGKSVLTYWQNVIGRIEELKRDTNKNSDLDKIKVDFFFNELIKENRERFSGIGAYYIPAQRTSIYEKKSVPSPIFDGYLNLINACRQSGIATSSGLSSVLNQKSLEILKGELSSSSKFDTLTLSNDIKISFSSASAGQQESGWILVILQYLINSNSSCFLVVEEPESHLDPKTQSLLTQAITLYSNLLLTNISSQVIITTHSPYVLATINNLMYARKVSENHGNEVYKIVPPELWLDPKRVGAYECVNGEIIDLIAEDGLIRNEKLDEMASIDINRVSNDLFAIQNEAIDEL